MIGVYKLLIVVWREMNVDFEMCCHLEWNSNNSLSFLVGHSTWKDKSHRAADERARNRSRRNVIAVNFVPEKYFFGNYFDRHLQLFCFRFLVFRSRLFLIFVCVVSIKKSPSSEEEEQIGRWAAMVKQRSLQIVDLRREFQGWHGNHERHCILHDVMLGWTAFHG